MSLSMQNMELSETTDGNSSTERDSEGKSLLNKRSLALHAMNTPNPKGKRSTNYEGKVMLTT